MKPKGSQCNAVAQFEQIKMQKNAPIIKRNRAERQEDWRVE